MNHFINWKSLDILCYWIEPIFTLEAMMIRMIVGIAVATVIIVSKSPDFILIHPFHPRLCWVSLISVVGEIRMA